MAKATCCFYSMLLLTPPFQLYQTGRAKHSASTTSRHSSRPNAASALPCALPAEFAQPAVERADQPVDITFPERQWRTQFQHIPIRAGDRGQHAMFTQLLD